MNVFGTLVNPVVYLVLILFLHFRHFYFHVLSCRGVEISYIVLIDNSTSKRKLQYNPTSYVDAVTTVH